jgi:hypothetical protein
MTLLSREGLSSSALVTYIREYVATESGTYISSADGSLDFVVMRRGDLRQFILSGPTTKARIIRYEKGTETIVIRLAPSVYISTIPSHMLLDRDIVLPSTGTHTFWLQHTAIQLPSFETADTFVRILAKLGILKQDRLVTLAMAGHSSRGTARTLQRHFLHTTGLTPQASFQIQRAYQAQNLLEAGMAAVNAANETGFYDQSHLTHAVTYFCGRTPAQIRRNPAGWQ